MNTHKKTVRDVEVRGKKVLLRCDFNVPQDKETGAITERQAHRGRAAHHPVSAGAGGGGHRLLPPGQAQGRGPDPEAEPCSARWPKRLSELLGREADLLAARRGGPRRRRPRPPPCSPDRFCCWRTPALRRARPKTTRRWPRSWPPWPTSMCPTPSAPCTAPTPPPPAWRLICPPSPAS